jgi:CHASE2 domain-containing sensor protein
MVQQAFVRARYGIWVERSRALLGSLWGALKERGVAYWLVAGLVLATAIVLSWQLDERDAGITPRYWIYQRLQMLSPRSLHPKRTALVMIGDKEFWGPGLMGRAPISRRYLAKLLLALDAADPQLIALDFDLHEPPSESEADRAADNDLLSAVACVATRRQVVLAADVEEQGQRQYVVAPSIYTGRGLSTDVFPGHLEAFGDLRLIPVGLHLRSGARQDSFAEAVVRAADPESLAGFSDEKALPFATFLERRRFLTLSAGRALASRPEELRRELRCRIVIVGASHSQRGDGRGEFTDVHSTPAGVMPGAYVQANYVEALLDSRAYRHLGRILAILIEAALGAAVAVMFTLTLGSWTRFVAMACLCLAAVVVGYIALQNFGRYFDFYLLVMFLIGHGIVAQILEWRENSRKYRKGYAQ